MADLLGMAFDPYYDHLMGLLETNKELKKTFKGIGKQMAWPATGAAVGGFFGGAVGAFVATVLGAMVSYWLSEDYQSMVNILRNLPDEDRRTLVRNVQDLVGNRAIDALTTFIGRRNQRRQLFTVINRFANRG